jgi:hypothetical protein
MCHFPKFTEISKRHSFRSLLGNKTFFKRVMKNVPKWLWYCSRF